MRTLPGVTVVRHDRGDSFRGCPLQRVDDYEKLHKMVVDRWRSTLDEKDILSSDVFTDRHPDFSIGES